METVHVKALKIMSDAKISLKDALQSNLEVFNFERNTDQDKKYTKEESETLLQYDVFKIGADLSKIVKRKDKMTYLNEQVKKDDKKLVLTEFFLKGLYEEETLGNVGMLEIFSFIPQCQCCGEKRGAEYFNTLKPHYRSRESIECQACKHKENVVMCQCERCVEKWKKLSDVLKQFDEYFQDGYVLVNSGNWHMGYELRNIEDVEIFLELISRDEIYPEPSFSLKGRDGEFLF